LLATDHDAFDYELILKDSSLIVDTRGRYLAPPSNVVKGLMRLVRLVTGLIVALFVVGHFLNHALGVVSIEAMDRVRVMLAAWWRSPVGSVLL
jgi:adenylate cyclase